METLLLRPHHPAPAFTLTGGPGAGTVALRDHSFRRDLLLVVLHGPGCPHCARTVAELAEHRDDWEGWGTGLLVLHSEPNGFENAFFRQAHDEGDAVRQRYAPAGADVVLALIDHRGRFMDGWSLQHSEPVDWHEVSETVRWVAVQEPECGACEVLPAWDEALYGR